MVSWGLVGLFVLICGFANIENSVRLTDCLTEAIGNHFNTCVTSPAARIKQWEVAEISGTDKTLSDMEEEIATLKNLLKEARKVNKRLKNQNRRQKQVWLALEQMCQALGQMDMEEREMDASSNDDNKVPPVQLPKRKFEAFRIQPLYVTSEGLTSSGEINVTVAFTSKKKPTLDWFFFLNTSSMYSKGGWVTQIESNDTYIAGITLSHELLKSSWMQFRVYDTRDFMGIRFNRTAIYHSSYESISPAQIELELVENIIYPSANDNFTTTFLVKGNVSTYTDVFTHISGLNMSAEPPLVFDMNLHSKWNNSAMDKSSSVAEIVSEVNTGQIKLGGILDLQLSAYSGPHALHSELMFGRRYSVSISDLQSAVPPKTTGVYPLPVRTLLKPPFKSIWCGGIGNPRPVVTLEKETAPNTVEIMTADVSIVRDEFTVSGAYTISANDPNVEGKYTCRVSNDYSVATESTEVICYQAAVINVSATGLTINSTDKLEITCKASGVPIPELSLTLFYEYGPDLAKSPRYKAVQSSADARTAVLVLTISPVDTNIARVYCNAHQKCDSHCMPVAVPIQIFPEPYYYNLDLYHELRHNETLLAD